MGSARNATLRLGGVPILWLPYIKFPITDDRRSGLLVPNLRYDSEDGFEYEQPIYWNIAPNMDATFKPRIITERGFMLGGEYRYLFRDHQGEFEGNWLPNDDIYGHDRGVASYRHHSNLGSQWYAGQCERRARLDLDDAPGGAARRDRDPRPWHRHRRGRLAAHLRSLLHDSPRRHWSWAPHRQEHHRGARWADFSCQHTGGRH